MRREKDGRREKAPAIRRQPKGASKDAGSWNSRKKRTRARETPPAYEYGEKKGMETSGAAGGAPRARQKARRSAPAAVAVALSVDGQLWLLSDDMLFLLGEMWKCRFRSFRGDP